MFACLGFMLAQRAADGWPVNKLRVWGVIFASWFMGMMAVVVSGEATPSSVWLIIDVLSAVFVLRIFRPVGFAQKLIGSMYALMVMWHFVFILGDGGQAPLYTGFQILVGWAQWGVLMLWSSGDVGKAYYSRFGRIRAVGVGNDDNGAGGR
jgi:hypothetical protein